MVYGPAPRAMWTSCLVTIGLSEDDDHVLRAARGTINVVRPSPAAS
jgi:hypothetical protein